MRHPRFASQESACHLSEEESICTHMLRCGSKGPDHRVPPLHRVQEFPALRELWIGINVNVSEKSVPYLRALESVKLFSRKYSLAHRIGASVTMFIGVTCVAREDIVKLETCSRLAHLNLHHNEYVPLLAEATPYLPNLRVLALSRDRSVDTSSADASSLYHAVGGSMLRIVQSLPKLEVLLFHKVVVAPEEVRAILAHLGSRLKSFSMSTQGRDDSELDTVLAMLLAMIAHNPELLEVGLNHNLSHQEFHNVDERVLSRGREVHAMIRLLKRRVPLLDTVDLERYAGALTCGRHR